MSIQDTDTIAAAKATAPRVSLKDIEDNIALRIDTTGIELAANPALDLTTHNSLRILSICLLVMKNGFTVIGKSAPASEQNYDMELGKRLAYEDAIRQLWPLMGYALREKLAFLLRQGSISANEAREAADLPPLS